MIFDPITCHGQSWGNFCQVCEQEEFDKFMHNNVEDNYVDVAEREYEYEDSVTCITCKNKKDSFSVKWDYAQCETCATKEYFNDAR